MQADAREAQVFSRKHLVLELDFSSQSVDELETQADTIEFALRGGKSQENIDLLSRLWGAYIGESIRKAAGGEWTRGEDDRVALKIGDQLFYPHEQLRQRLVEGNTYNLTTYFQAAVN